MAESALQSFNDIRENLIELLTSDHRRPDYPTERDVLQAHRKVLEDLYTTSITARHASGIDTSVYPTNPEAFSSRVIGDTPNDSRAKILRILLRLEINPLAPCWSRFLENVCLHCADEPPQGFCDASLPFLLQGITELFGEEGAAAFISAQYRCYPVDLSSSFDTCTETLRCILETDKIVTGKVIDKAGRQQTEQLSDRFCSAVALAEFVEEEKNLILDLYKATLKAKAKTQKYGLPHGNQNDLQDSPDRDEKAFHRSVQKYSRVFATLVWMGSFARLSMWTKFVDLCVGFTEAVPRFRDDNFPLNRAEVRNLFGTRDGQDEVFFERQFTFCPVKLKEDRQERFEQEDHRLRLPLTHKKEVSEGHDRSVFCVTVARGHFADEEGNTSDSDRTFAMKKAVLTPANAREWDALTWLFEQPLKHDNIMRAKASLVTQTTLYIFFPWADCNLMEYWLHRMPLGMSDLSSMRPHFNQLIGIAGSLKYLHRDLQQEEARDPIECYHLDVKPENILVTIREEKVVYQIADFGISVIKQGRRDSTTLKMVRDSSTPRQSSTTCRLGDGVSNFPPEGEDHGRLNAKADVWEFGTVFAPFVAWLAGGAEQVSQFEKASATYEGGEVKSLELYERDSQPKVFRLKSGVRNYFTDLVQSADSQGSLKRKRLYQDCWDLLSKELLVCDRDARADMAEIVKHMTNIYHNGLIENDIPGDSEGHGHSVEESVTPGAAPNVWDDNLQPARTTATANTAPEHLLPSATIQSGGVDSWMERSRTSPDETPSTSMRNRLKNLFKSPRARTPPQAASRPNLLEDADPRTVHESEGTLLHRATITGDVGMVRSLLKSGVSVNVRDRQGLTPFLKACQLNRPSVTDMLSFFLESGGEVIDVEATDEAKATALMHAAHFGILPAVNRLIEVGANIYVHDRNQETALHYAVRGDSDAGICRVLLSRDSDRKLLCVQTNHQGQTALHLCAANPCRASLEKAEVILQYGAEVNLEDAGKETPLEAAVGGNWTSEREAMVKLLLKHGALVTQWTRESRHGRQFKRNLDQLPVRQHR